MARKLKWAGPRYKTPRMKIIMARAVWNKKKKKNLRLKCTASQLRVRGIEG